MTMPTAKVTFDRSSRVFHPLTITDEMAERFRTMGQHEFKVALTNTPPMSEREMKDITVLQTGDTQPDGACIVTYAAGRDEARFDPLKVAFEGVRFRPFTTGGTTHPAPVHIFSQDRPAYEVLYAEPQEPQETPCRNGRTESWSVASVLRQFLTTLWSRVWR